MDCSRRWPAGGPDSTGGTRAAQAATGPRFLWTGSLSAQSCLPLSAAPGTQLDTPRRAPLIETWSEVYCVLNYFKNISLNMIKISKIIKIVYILSIH